MQLNNTPAILVIFGMTGDLADRKIIPSLWQLFGERRLPAGFFVIGFSRRDLSKEEFKNLIRSSLLKHGADEMKEEDFTAFFKIFSYQKGTFEDKEAFSLLADTIAQKENAWGICANKLFYLATPPPNYGIIFKNLAGVKLNLPCGGKLGWSRILIEKPFGLNLTTAQSLQRELSLYFKEEQIYRIDHYLFKEIVQGIENFRFSNNLFENIWDNTTIDRIDLHLHESIGVEDRGSFYDSVGALRDVGQSHLLSILALLTMEYPQSLGVNALRRSRAEILGTLSPWTGKTLKQNTSRAQHASFRNIEGVSPNSQTETYFALKTELLHPKWKGIPIFMEAGKRLKEARKEIILTLKHPPVCHLCGIGPHGPNRVIFRMEPNHEIIINFWTKKPGLERILEQRSLSFFLYERKIKAQYVEEYAEILNEAMAGRQSLFLSPEEIEAMWRFTDPVVLGWRQNLVPLAQYQPGTTPTPPLLELMPDIVHKKEESRTGEIGIIGMGKMGSNLSRQLISKGFRVVGFNRTPDAVKEMEKEGLEGAYSLEELIGKLAKPRLVWIMVPYQAVDELLDKLKPLLDKGDTIIDGGNSLFKDSAQREKELEKPGINFLDAGVSGGPAGARYGACIMVGGKKELYEKYEYLFKSLSVRDGYGYMGKSGAGHFVKMVHNGIEYGMMQAIAEGFTLLGKSRYKLDLSRVADIYNHGSVIESRLIGWLKAAFKLHGENLANVSGVVGRTGEGEWTVKTAREFKIKDRIIADAVKFRKESEKHPDFTGKILSSLREQFGEHKATV